MAGPKMANESAMGKRLRWGGLALLALTLAWLPFEDLDIWATMALASLFGLWLFARLVWHRDQARTSELLGMLCGALVPVTALGLMVFKSGLHAHGFSDFSFAQILDVLELTPATIGLGFLLGFLRFRAQIGIGEGGSLV
jgi:hypothetical protein